MRHKNLLLTLAAISLLMPCEANVARNDKKINSQIERLSKDIEERQALLLELRTLRGDEMEQPTVSFQVEELPVVEELPPPPQEEVTTTVQFNPMQIDSLLNEWRERESMLHYENFFKQFVAIDDFIDSEKDAVKDKNYQAVDSLYQARLLKLASPVHLPYNNIVRAYIDRYINPSSSLMSNVISRSHYFFPSIEEELIKRDLPVELRAMAIIESALTTSAISSAGAAGLWQFMPTTGKMYNLEINSLIDERCDPFKATIAACEFLGDLYEIYEDWSLAIAAYNCGPGNVNKALARSGLKEGTFWDIYDYLPRETRGYVPAFIAANYAYAYHKEHNIVASDIPFPIATDTVTVNRIMHLEQVAQTIDLPIEVLRQLNPQYRRDIVPATTKSYALRLPQRFITPYITNEQKIHSKDSLYLKEYVNPANIERLRSTPRASVHIVRSGDTLGGIARKYRVTVKQLMAWNSIKNANRLSLGQRIEIRK